MLFDFHTHTFLSDGVLSPIELMRRAAANGYTAMAVTDHAGINDQERVLEILVKECAEATENMAITADPRRRAHPRAAAPHRRGGPQGEGERGEGLCWCTARPSRSRWPKVRIALPWRAPMSIFSCTPA